MIDFFLGDRYKTFKGDGGNELYDQILQFIKAVQSEVELEQIKDEIRTWLLIGRSSFVVIAANLIADLKLLEYKDDLLLLRSKIIKHYIPDIPANCLAFIDQAIKRQT